MTKFSHEHLGLYAIVQMKVCKILVAIGIGIRMQACRMFHHCDIVQKFVEKIAEKSYGRMCVKFLRKVRFGPT